MKLKSIEDHTFRKVLPNTTKKAMLELLDDRINVNIDQDNIQRS